MNGLDEPPLPDSSFFGCLCSDDALECRQNDDFPPSYSHPAECLHLLHSSGCHYFFVFASSYAHRDRTSREYPPTTRKVAGIRSPHGPGRLSHLPTGLPLFGSAVFPKWIHQEFLLSPFLPFLLSFLFPFLFHIRLSDVRTCVKPHNGRDLPQVNGRGGGYRRWMGRGSTVSYVGCFHRLWKESH